MNLITTYQQASNNLGSAISPVQHVYMLLAREMDGLTALAISCAVRGEGAETAAAHCQCTIAELDRAIALLAVWISAGRREVAA